MGQTLELLERLRDGVRDFKRRGDQLERAYRISVGNLQREIEEAAGQHGEASSEIINQAKARQQDQLGRLEQHFAAREARIHTAHQHAHQSRLEEANEREGRAKFKWQRGLLDSTRKKDADLKAQDEALANYQALLAEEEKVLATVELRAQRTLKAYASFERQLDHPPKSEAVAPSVDENKLLEKLRHTLDEVTEDTNRIRQRVLAPLFAAVPVWVWIILVALVLAPITPLLNHFGKHSFTFQDTGMVFGGCVVVLVGLYFLGKQISAGLAMKVAAGLGKARRLYEACGERAETHHQQERERIQREFEETTRTLEDEWARAQTEARETRATLTVRTGERAKRLLDSNTQCRTARLAALQEAHARELEQLACAASAAAEKVTAERTAKEQAILAEHEGKWRELAIEWAEAIKPIYATINEVQQTGQTLFPAWEPADWLANWEPPQEFAHLAEFARANVDVGELAGELPDAARLKLPGPAQFTLPLMLKCPEAGSILFETKGAGRDEAVGALNNLILRLLSRAPAGRLSFTIFDPAELGQSFAGIMHLADYEERLINSRIWTQTAQMEEQLGLLNEHIEKVAQMYLRNEYQTITEYNLQAGRIAEKYHFLVIADFPTNFSDVAVKRLQSIAASGARCGVYTLIHWDQRRTPPADFVAEELRENSVCVRRQGTEFVIGEEALEGVKVELSNPPAPEVTTDFLHRVGKASIDSNRVEVPFDDVVPPDNEMWCLETTTELRVPIGRTGATKLQYLSLGKGTRQHALMAGKTGSGKSTLFHVIVTNLALWCSPDQVEFYLVDFKKGVEFKCYGTHRLPHARVIAIESDREFGLSVLERVDEELKRRGEMFRKLGVQDVAGYKRAGGKEAIPRTLLMIDEFQELFVEDDRVSQNAALLLDRIVRQGRAFGIHVLLGSQTLGGAYTLARTTLGQMVVRIALQCNEADAYLIMDDTNPAPRLLSRPGEAIYNDSAGSIEGNSPFQIVWLSDQERDVWLEKVRRHASETGVQQPAPIVFEGNAPADVTENLELRNRLKAGAIAPVSAARAWLGAPNSIKGPTEVAFQKLSGNNLLVVGQREEAALSLLGISLISLAAQHPKGAARFIIFEALAPESPQRRFLESIVAAIPHEITLAKAADIDGVMTQVNADLTQRSESAPGTEAPTCYLFIHELQKFKKLRYEEDFGFSLDESQPKVNPGQVLNQVITDGPTHGIHVAVTCDTYNNVTRFLSRKAISEFEMRVLFQMSANDSASLIDTPKAGDLGLHRALLHNGQEGFLETFRPYALPEKAWIEEAGRDLQRLLG